MSKLPAFQFYPGDWMKDPAVRRCSHAAKGFWIDLLCLMFECEERGVLISAGVPWSDEEVAAAVPGDTSANLLLLRELLAKGVAKRDNRQAIFNARMMRDEKTRRERSKAGSKGVYKREANRKQNIGSSVSSSLSTSGKGESPPPIVPHETKIQTVFREPLFDRLTEQGRIAIQEEYSGHEVWLYDTLSRYSQDCAAKNVFVINPSTLFRYLAEDFRRKDRKAKPTGRDYSRDNQELEEKMRQWKQEAQA